MNKAFLTIAFCLGALVLLNYPSRSTAQSACPGGPVALPTDIGYASIILATGRFSGAVPPNAPDPANDVETPEAINIRVRPRPEAGYDGRDVYNSAPNGSCAIAQSDTPPNVPIIAGNFAGPAGVQNASELRFVLAAEAPVSSQSKLHRLTLRFYRNDSGSPSVAPFYITDLPAIECDLSTGYYVFILSQEQVAALQPAIDEANNPPPDTPDCLTHIYVGARLDVEHEDTNGVILYVGKLIGAPACTFSITPSTAQTFDASGGTGLVNVNYTSQDTGCLWQASENASGITITSGDYGSKDVTVKYRVDPNNTGSTRSATLTVAGQQLTITQSCVSITPPREREVDPNGGQRQIQYTQQGAGCSVTANSNVAWIPQNQITVQNGVINYAVLPNNSAGTRGREGKITISGFDYIVKQAGTDGDCIPKQIEPGASTNGARLKAGDCPSSLDSSRVADHYFIDATVNPATGLHVSFSLAGTFNARLNLKDPNGRVMKRDDPPPLFITLPISGRYTLEVTQATASDFFDYTLSMCSFTFTPSTLHATYIGGTGTINVTSQSGCDWDASSNDAGWLHVTSGPDYNPSDVVSFSADSVPLDPQDPLFPNRFKRRVNAVTIAGKSFLITQLGIPFYYTDFNNDRKTDVVIYRPSNGHWFINNGTIQQWTLGNDRIVPGDYDGDGRTDFAVWRPADGIWKILNSSHTSVSFQSERIVEWGVNGDIPVPADYDGDGKTDIAAWRPSTGVWFIIKSSTGGLIVIQWGLQNDTPVPADYDGDGRVDIAQWRSSNGGWYILSSLTDYTTLLRFVVWGIPTDKAVPADYDGDRKADIAVWRPSTGVWFIINSSNGAVSAIQWGLNTDKPVIGDFDGIVDSNGNTHADISIYRPTSGGNSFWWVRPFPFAQWGDLNDIPVPAAFVR